jgi:protease-4
MDRAGLAALTEIRTALLEFKKSGKTIVAYSDVYDQSHYYLASAADEIFADPLGEFMIRGFAVYNRYYGEGLERLGVDVNYFQAGKYKSYGEIYTRSSMSEAAREENLTWSGELWSNYVKTVSSSRGLSEKEFNDFIDDYVILLSHSGGSTVNTALQTHLIDGLLDRNDLRNHMAQICGYSFEYDSFNQIFFEDYLYLNRKEMIPSFNSKVAVISASGTIYNGYADPGKIGGDSLVEMLDSVQMDKNYKALVLRVDSGGGSAFASEIIRRKLEKLRASGVPVVVSMGSVAASGGYWIATASDEIWAQETTITGSIGVFSIIPTFEDPLKDILGVHVDGVGTTWLAGSMRFDKNLDHQVGKIYQSSVDFIYSEFLSRVSESRKQSVEEIHKIAQGRVWSGEEALNIGLVDKIGGLSDAVESAAELAGLEENAYSAEFIVREIPMSDQILETLLNSSVSDRFLKNFSLLKLLSENQVWNSLKDLEDLNDPSGIFALSTLMFE